ncbi:hypothetical protein [Azospirillum halopraeferens]|uniref:hypothetical protein n=1 Tax=Azospirillum halopraeferens TaxID=34010 RepID=UPI00041E98C1|nr:hypothetical protein [Azospirillum halopraeferens]
MTIRRSVLPAALSAVLAAGVLSGCANPMAEQAMTARTALVGLPKERLLSCAGVPQRQATAGGMEFFTYRSDQVVSYPSPRGYYGWPGYGYGWGGWPAYADDIRSYACEATFTLQNGAVRQVVYSGMPGGGAGIGQCYYIVQNCLAAGP